MGFAGDIAAYFYWLDLSFAFPHFRAYIIKLGISKAVEGPFHYRRSREEVVNVDSEPRNRLRSVNIYLIAILVGPAILVKVEPSERPLRCTLKRLLHTNPSLTPDLTGYQFFKALWKLQIRHSLFTKNLQVRRVTLER